MADGVTPPVGGQTPPAAGRATKVISPYTLFSSDNPGAVITSMLFNGENYNEWSREMLNALQAKRKTTFVKGTLTKPAADSPDYENWLTVNLMLVGWIRSSIEPKIRATVTFVLEAHQLWTGLKQRFSIGNKVHIHQLKAHIASCRQEGQSVLDYFGRLSKLWDELLAYQPLHTCTCGASLEYSEEKEEEKIHQFLMGLDDSRFNGVCTSIIDRDPLPTMGDVYQKVVREEQRLLISRGRENRQEAVGYVARQVISEVKTRIDYVNVLNFSDSSSLKPRDRNATCSHCGRLGHEKRECWQLVGFPEW